MSFWRAGQSGRSRTHRAGTEQGAGRAAGPFAHRRATFRVPAQGAAPARWTLRNALRDPGFGALRATPVAYAGGSLSLSAGVFCTQLRMPSPSSAHRSARDSSSSIAPNTSARNVWATSGLRSKYQRKAARKSASAAGSSSTLKRFTVRRGASWLPPREQDVACRRATPPGVAPVRRARLRRRPSGPRFPGFPGAQPPVQNAPRPAGRGPRRAAGQRARPCVAVYAETGAAVPRRHQAQQARREERIARRFGHGLRRRRLGSFDSRCPMLIEQLAASLHHQ